MERFFIRTRPISFRPHGACERELRHDIQGTHPPMDTARAEELRKPRKGEEMKNGVALDGCWPGGRARPLPGIVRWGPTSWCVRVLSYQPLEKVFKGDSRTNQRNERGKAKKKKESPAPVRLSLAQPLSDAAVGWAGGPWLTTPFPSRDGLGGCIALWFYQIIGAHVLLFLFSFFCFEDSGRLRGCGVLHTNLH